MFRTFAIILAACILGCIILFASERGNEGGSPANKISYATHIRPLFRPKDIEHMKKNRNFDLSKYADVKANSINILAQLQHGHMPCDGAWPQSGIDKFKQWIEDGMLP